jgi:hypothetical protein
MPPNFRELSLLELKQYIKRNNIKIKHYYIMKREQLIELLSMADLPEEIKMDKLTIIQLREMAKEQGVRGIWSLNREALMTLVFRETAHKNEKNKDDADKHDDPQEHYAENVGVQNL